MAVRAFVLCCTLDPTPAASNSELLGRQVLTALAEHNVAGDLIRVVDHRRTIRPRLTAAVPTRVNAHARIRTGASTDGEDGDDWPGLRARLLAADILVIVTPIRFGQPAEVCKVVL